MANGGENNGRARAGFWAFAAKFFVIIVAAFLLIWGLSEYKKYEGRRNVDKLAEAFKKAQKEDYERAMADTYGGKTPQETLRMYIEAVEAGNFELASKYFIFEKQEKELTSLKNSPKKNTENVIYLLKQSIESKGSFSADGGGYVITEPLLVDFKLYPNSIWKIIEI